MKKIIVRIAEGLGNQLFMYANAYALSKKINYTLFTDTTSGYFKKKNQFRKNELFNFNISANEINSLFKYDNYLLDFKRKIQKKFDIFLYNKNFLIENIDRNKHTEYNNYSNFKFSNHLKIEGYFQCEKYFYDFKDELVKEFQIKNIKPPAKSLEKQEKVRIFTKNCDCDKT